jgi:hypothetical protein
LSCALIYSVSIVPTSCVSSDQQSVNPVSDVDLLYQNINFKAYIGKVMSLSEKLKSNTLDNYSLSENDVNSMVQNKSHLSFCEQIGFENYNDYNATVESLSKDVNAIISDIP